MAGDNRFKELRKLSKDFRRTSETMAWLLVRAEKFVNGLEDHLYADIYDDVTDGGVWDDDEDHPYYDTWREIADAKQIIDSLLHKKGLHAAYMTKIRGLEQIFATLEKPDGF